MIFSLVPGNIEGLPVEEQEMLVKLVDTFQIHRAKNAEKDKYYEGKISLRDVNLGIAIPETFRGLEIGCAWGAKTVDVLASRSMFDGFVGANGEDVAELDKLVEDNRLVAQYMLACRDELKFGSDFATLSSDPVIGCKIRFHSAQTASAIWDGEKGRIAYGMAIIDTAPTDVLNVWEPSLINMYTDDAVWVLRRIGNGWIAEEHRHRMGRPLMEPMTWNATSNKPFGRSRIKEPVRRLIQGYVRTSANATLGLEFSTSPQKYIMGVSDQMYDALINDKFKQYVGNIIAGTVNPDPGEKPTFGQLQQGSIAPHVEMIRVLATQFSAATGLTVTDTGVVNDANPTSADAVLAQSQTLVSLAEQLNIGNGDALKTIALMALAISNNTTVDELSDEQKDIVAHFKNPALPSIAASADAAIKIASARPNFAQTDVFAEMLGFDKADIRRIKAQEARARGMELLNASFT